MVENMQETLDIIRSVTDMASRYIDSFKDDEDRCKENIERYFNLIWEEIKCCRDRING